MTKPDKPAPLSLVGVVPDRVFVTGALRDGHWLSHRDDYLFEGATVLFVADNLEAEARQLWPTAHFSEPRGMGE